MKGLVSSRPVFRSIDEWKSSLMNLPENSFFDLLRSVLGNIKTPFSKQKLLDDLHNFLLRDEIRKIIAAYINEQDKMIIAAVALLNEPAPAELETFLAGEFTTAELRAAIINLEERLILYRFREGSGAGFRGEKFLRLALNPALERVLAPFAEDTRALFPSLAPEENGGTDEDRRTAFAADGRFMAALFAFILGEDDLFKVEGEVRKKVLDEGKKIFPGLDLNLAIKIFLRLGLFRAEGRGLVSCDDKVADYCALSDVEKLEYWAAALCLCRNESDPLARDSVAHSGGAPFEINDSRFSWSRLRELAYVIHRFRSRLDPGGIYPEITLRRLWEFLGKEDNGPARTWASPLFSEKVQYSFELMLTLLEETGLLKKTGVCGSASGGNTSGGSATGKNTSDENVAGENFSGWKTPAVVSPHSAAAEESAGILPAGTAPVKNSQAEKPVVVMDAAFSFIMYPEISFSDAVTLGGFCSVKENAETAVRFEVTRQAVVRAFNHGMKAGDMIALLDRLSLNRLEPNLAWTLKDWENRYTGVSLNEGIVLTLAEDRRYLAEARPVSALIVKTLAPGVYLLSADEKSEAVRALVKAGVDIVAQPPPDSAKSRDSHHRSSFTRLEPSGDKPIPAAASAGTGKEAPPSAAPLTKGKKTAEGEAPSSGSPDFQDSIKQNFRETLEKMKLGKQEKDELLARIERRLILTEAQLEGTSLRYEKLEAKGLDYPGKAAIAKQAIELGSIVDVSWPGRGDELNRSTGIAQMLEKKDGDTILVLRSGERNDKNARVIRIPLGKISLIRRIKQSIFEE